MTMLRISLVLSLAVAASASAGGASRVPDRMANDRSPTAWIAADVAVRPDGSVREELLTDEERERIESHARAAAEIARRSAAADADGCHSFFGGAPSEGALPSPEALLAQSPAIYRGRIEGIREGFYAARPGSMLRLSGSYLRGAGTEETYVFYPSAKIKLADAMLCARPPARYPVPRVGDELIVFAAEGMPRRFGDRTVLWVTVIHDVVYIPADGTAVLPSPLGGSIGAFQAAAEPRHSR